MTWQLQLAVALVALGVLWRFSKWLGRWFEAKQEAYRLEVVAEAIQARGYSREPKHLAGAEWKPVELEGEAEAYVNPDSGEILVPGVKSV